MSFDPTILAAWIAPTIGAVAAVMVGTFINWRATKRVEASAIRAQTAATEAAIKIQEANARASDAAKAAAESAKQLVLAAKASNEKLDRSNDKLDRSNDKLDHSNDKLDQIANTGEATHTIVNSQRSAMERLVQDLKNEVASLKSQLAIKTELRP